MRYPSNHERDQEDWGGDNWPAWEPDSTGDATEGLPPLSNLSPSNPSPFHDAIEETRQQYHRMQLAYVDALVADGALYDPRATRYLQWLIRQDRGHVRYDARTHTGHIHYLGAWHDAALFCVKAGEERGHDSAPRWRGGW